MKKADLISALKNHCIAPGSKLVVHSSYKSIDFEGSPEEVCKSFMEAIGEEGLLVMPAHSPIVKGTPFNPGRTPSEVGAITEAFRRLPRVSRSLHPSHSVAAWGRGAKELTAGHQLVDSEGEGSPFFKFSQTDGKILMLGCTLRACTMGHVAEWVAKVPHLGVPYSAAFTPTAEYIDDDGKVKTYVYKTYPGCSKMFDKAIPWLKEAGFLKEISLNKETSLLVDAAGFVKIVSDKLKEDSAALLTDSEEHFAKCSHCREVRRLAVKKP